MKAKRDGDFSKLMLRSAIFIIILGIFSLIGLLTADVSSNLTEPRILKIEKQVIAPEGYEIISQSSSMFYLCREIETGLIFECGQ